VVRIGLTGQGNFYLTVREGPKGKPILALEPTGHSSALLTGGFIALKLLEGTMFAEAQSIAEEMKKHVIAATVQLRV
jgi:hypothetical protein